MHGNSCSTTVLCLVIHAGSALDATMDLPAKKSDVTTFKGAFESVIRQHYPSMMGKSVLICPVGWTYAGRSPLGITAYRKVGELLLWFVIEPLAQIQSGPLSHCLH